MFHVRRDSDLSEQLLTSPSAIFSRLICDIQRAQQSIDLEFYIFEADRIGGVISKLLCRKSRQGVRVRLLVDGYGSRSLPRCLVRSMSSCGVDVCSTGVLGQARNHRKLVIIDGLVGYVGGINVADRYISGNGLGVWHDVMLRFTGSAVASLTAIFEHDYHVGDVAGGVIEPHASFPMLHWSECSGGGAMTRLLRDVLDSATSSLTFTTPYFMPPSWVISEMIKVRERGVKVRIIVPERCDIWTLDDIMRCHISDAVSSGIEVMVLRGAFVHAKMAVVDSRRVVLGSANLDSRSLSVNSEIMVSTYNRGVCRSAMRFVEYLSRHATQAVAADMRSHIPRFIVRLLSPVL